MSGVSYTPLKDLREALDREARFHAIIDYGAMMKFADERMREMDHPWN